MLLPIAQQILFLLLVPAYLIYILAKGTEQDKFSWLLKTVTVGAFFVFLTLAGHWEWFSYYLRFVPLPAFVVVAVISYRRVRDTPFLADDHRVLTLGTGIEVAEALVAIGLMVFTLRGYSSAPNPVRLTFPLKDGSYEVANGGTSRLVNLHYPVRPQKYAIDVTELNDLGMRARGIYPSDPERYVIYGEPVYSPCDGTVTAAVDIYPSQNPPERNTEHVAGNHVILECQGVKILLAHLQQDSVTVEEGETVTTGQQLGRVGNTGNTTEPHLHIHAVDAGTGDVLHGSPVPMLFDGEFAVRNMVFEQQG